MKLKLNEIEKDDDIYPRQKVSGETIRSYAEALKAGATFPAICVQKISIETDDAPIVKIISLDGWHRLRAHRLYNEEYREKGKPEIEEIEIEFLSPKILDKEENLEMLRFESAIRNSIHGDRMSKDDLKFQIRRIAQSNPKISAKEISDKFGSLIVQQTVSNWTKDLTKSEEWSRRSLIFRMSLLGFKSPEISDLLKITPSLKGIESSAVRTITADFTNFSKIVVSDYESGKKTQKIAEYHKVRWIDAWYQDQYDIALTWAIILKDKEDFERFQIFGESQYGNEEPKLFNVWDFPRMDSRLGLPAPGHNPGQIDINLLYYYTNPRDLVVDPMAGGASIIDASLVMGRCCRAYDTRNVWEYTDPETEEIERFSRPDLLSRNFWEEGYDPKTKGCDFIFLDPPHYDIVFEDYYESLEDFHDKMAILAEESLKTVKKKGHVSLLMLDKTKGDYRCLTADCYRIFMDAGFECVAKISAPLGASSASKSEMSQAKMTKKMLGRNRNLYVFRK